MKKAQIAANSKSRAFLSSFVIGCGTLLPEMYNLFIKERAIAYRSVLHGKDKLLVSHSSGEDIFPLWDYMLDINLDVIHGFCTTPVRNKDLSHILRTYGKRITVWGGLDSHFLYHGSVREIEEAIKRILDVVIESRVPFVLGSSDDLVPGTPLKNLEAVSKIAGRMKY